MKVNLKKMNGLGNDFLIYDARNHDGAFNLSIEQIVELSARDNSQTGGCDQFIVMEPLEGADVDVFMRIYNADGTQVDACGNATRCIGWLVAHDLGRDDVLIKTNADILKSSRNGDFVTVDMGVPKLNWDEIPLSRHIEDTASLPIEASDEIKYPVAVNMGNPHMVFLCAQSVDEIDVTALGAPLESHLLYPEKANIGFANVVDKDNIRLRVFERGVGETKACGTGACAALVAAVRRGLTNREAMLHLNGGILNINWSAQTGHVLMTGEAEFEKDLVVEIGRPY